MLDHWYLQMSHTSAAVVLLAFRCAGAYVWSVGSFDVFGVHPVSSSSQGSFADSSIIAMAKKQNGMS